MRSANRAPLRRHVKYVIAMGTLRLLWLSAHAVVSFNQSDLSTRQPTQKPFHWPKRKTAAERFRAL